MASGRILVVMFALLLVSYVGGYIGMSNPSRSAVCHGGGCTSWVEPNYRVVGDLADPVFWPLEQLDRRVRPKVWATKHYSFDSDAVWPTAPPD